LSNKLEESVMEFVDKGSEFYPGDLPDKPQNTSGKHINKQQKGELC
jgi:hypothetical protein